MLRPSVRLLLIIMLLKGTMGCDFRPDQVQPPNWQVEILGPLAIADLNANDVIDVRELDITFLVSANQAGFPDGFYESIPAFGPINIGFVDTVANETIAEVWLNSCVFELEVFNGFPINAKAGTIVELTNRDGSLITSITLAEDLAANTGRLEIRQPLQNVRLTKDVRLLLRNFHSEGSPEPVTIAGNQFRASFRLLEYDINRLVVETDQSFSIADTASFSLSGDVVDTDAVEGYFVFYTENGLPVQFIAQGYFLAADRQTVIDSLFASPLTIQQAEIDGSGAVIRESNGVDSIFVSGARLDRIRQADYFLVWADLSSESRSGRVVISIDQLLKVQLVGDFKLKLN